MTFIKSFLQQILKGLHSPACLAGWEARGAEVEGGALSVVTDFIDLIVENVAALCARCGHGVSGGQ